MSCSSYKVCYRFKVMIGANRTQEDRSPSFSSWSLAPFSGSLGLLYLRFFLNQQGVQLKSLGQNHIPDAAAPNCELIQLDRILIQVETVIPLMVILTLVRKVFILISTPLTDPTTMVPFLSQIVTVSFLSFIRNLTNFIPIIIRVSDPLMDHSNSENSQFNEQTQIKKVESELGHYREKYEVQQKRIEFLKRENEELRHKKHENGQVSASIKQQNQSLKKRNRELKSQMNELKVVMQCSNTSNTASTVSLKSIVVTAHSQEIDLPHSQVNDQDLQSIKEFHAIKSLILGENLISNFGMYTICNSFQNLRKLFINHNQVSDDGVSSIGKLKKLRCLDMRCNKITSEALLYISKLHLLNQLSISNNAITDDNMDLLEELKQLKYLDITSNQIGEKGGMAIDKLIGLNNLYLSHNKVTAACLRLYLKHEELKVLDLRFNQISNEDKEELRESRKEDLQLFL